MSARRLARVAALGAVLAVLLATAGPAAAAGPPAVLSLQAPASATLGEEITLVATLRTAGGEPISKARISFASPAEFAGVAGEMDLGSALTDEAGTAVFPYQPRQTGEIAVLARFAGGDRDGAGEARAVLAVSGGRQLYIARAGLDLPFFAVTMLAGALFAVFTMYTAAVLMVLAIARAGRDAEGVDGE